MVARPGLGAAARHAGASPVDRLAALELGTRILAEAKVNVQAFDCVGVAAKMFGLYCQWVSDVVTKPLLLVVRQNSLSQDLPHVWWCKDYLHFFSLASKNLVDAHGGPAPQRAGERRARRQMKRTLRGSVSVTAEATGSERTLRGSVSGANGSTISGVYRTYSFESTRVQLYDLASLFL